MGSVKASPSPSARRRSAARLALTAAALAVAACDKVPSQAVTRCEQTLVTPGAVKTDILFVVDDSGSMADAQTQLQLNFQAFVDRLASSTVKNDFQIGVTTTSVHRYVSGSYPGTFFDGGSCQGLYPAATPYPAGALVSVTAKAGTSGDAFHRVQSTTGTSPPRILLASSPSLVSDFTQDVNVGVCGSGKEQGLDAAKRALEAAVPGGVNDGFLRSGARLAVIIVSDDDDCSDPLHLGTDNEPPGCTSYPVRPYIDFFQAPIAGEPRPVVFGLIISVDPTTLQPAACSPPSGTVEHAATRYREFADAFGAAALVDSICKASFHDTLVAMAGLIDPGQVLPLDGTPADWRLLAVSVTKASGQVVRCAVGDTAGASIDAVYLPPLGSSPARLQFQNACLLQQGDSVDVKVVCAG
jgi:hypothetical protein